MAGDGADILVGGSGADVIEGSGGDDTARFSGARADYTISRNPDGSYAVVDKTPNRDGNDILRNVEKLIFADQIFLRQNLCSLISSPPISRKARPLPRPTRSFWEGRRPSLASSSLSRGTSPPISAPDRGPFSTTRTSSSTSQTPSSRAIQRRLRPSTPWRPAPLSPRRSHRSTRPLSRQPSRAPTASPSSPRPDGLKFYQDVARERGITAENGPAVTALASLLKIAVDGKNGIGNPVSDLIASIAEGSAGLPATSQVVLPIETIDGTKFDADDAPDAQPNFLGLPLL